MLKNAYISLLVIFSLLLLFCFEQSSHAKGAQEEQDMGDLKPVGTAISYKRVDNKDLHLYVLKPEDWKLGDKRPALVFFHGGGWEIGKGRPTQFNNQCKYFVTRGLVCIQVEYRLIQNNKLQVPIVCCQDAKSSMRYVRSHAAELGVDPDRIASFGSSAGGHLAAFVGMVEGTDDPQDDLKVSCKPAAMILYCPALLIKNPIESSANVNNPAKQKKFALLSEGIIEQYKKISPFMSISSDDPPGLIQVGDQDGLLPPDDLKLVLDTCQKAGIRMESVVYPGEGHSFFSVNDSLDRFLETTVASDKFLASLGWVQGPPTLTMDQVKEMAAQTLSPKKKSKKE
jgi:acetyl esterase